MESIDPISTAALVTAAVSFFFAVHSWRGSHRPIAIVRVTNHGPGGDICTLIDLMIENVGNRPAKDILLSVSSNDLNLASSDHI